MYERFTDRARKVMQLANQEAQRFNHEYIGTEHILLGLIKEGSGVAANVLKNLDIDLRKIRLEVEKIVQTGPGSEMVMMGKLPQTPRAKKVIEYAIEEARNLNHNYVGTEHLLLGLLREAEGVAAQVLINLGLKLEDVRQEVLNLLGHNMPPSAPKTDPKSTRSSPTPALDGHGRNLTRLAQSGQLDSAGGRPDLISRCREHLNCLERKCLLLVTDSPFERRSAMEGLARVLVAAAAPGEEPAWRL
jgi:ATP-dependent Clp protease ATP-binding subunit ClpC